MNPCATPPVGSWLLGREPISSAERRRWGTSRMVWWWAWEDEVRHPQRKPVKRSAATKRGHVTAAIRLVHSRSNRSPVLSMWGIAWLF